MSAVLDHRVWVVRLIEDGWPAAAVVWESRFEGQDEAEAFAAWLGARDEQARVEVVPPED